MKIHFISIGGSVMHQLAIALHKKGDIVTGSDDEIVEPSKSALSAYGLLPSSFGWNPDHIQKDIDAILLGMHAREDNPELIRVRELGMPVFSFPEYIYKESIDKLRVVVGGSHGKTTTTGMIMHVLQSTGARFDYLVGAKLPGFEQSVSITDAPVIICEGDEYPASALERRPKFHFLFPFIAVLTGIAWDHINVFPTFENYLEQFQIFIDKIEPKGTLIYCESDPELKVLIAQQQRSDITFIPYGLPIFEIKSNQTYLTVEGETGLLSVFGNHNLLNIQAAWLVCKKLGVSAEDFVKGIGSFKGASRRLEVVAQNETRIVFRDFAHAPSKVKATMEAVRSQYPVRRLVAVLELHTYSSLNAAFMPQYKGALQAADAACVFYSPHAMEIKQMPELPVQLVAEGFDHPELTVCTNRANLEEWLATQQNKGENLLLMSSGTYDGLNINATAEGWLRSK